MIPNPEGELDAALEDALATLAAYSEAKTRLRALLRYIGSQRAAGLYDGLQAEIVQRIYWDHRDIPVGDLAAATGIRVGEVHRHVGRVAPVECPDCGTVVRMVQDSRHAAPLRFGYCDDCQRQRDEAQKQRNEEWELGRQARQARHAEWVQCVVAEGGYWIDDMGEIVTGTSRTDRAYCYRARGECVERITLSEWENGGDVTWVCGRCGRHSEAQLVLWVPRQPAGAPSFDGEH